MYLSMYPARAKQIFQDNIRILAHLTLKYLLNCGVIYRTQQLIQFYLLFEPFDFFFDLTNI